MGLILTWFSARKRISTRLDRLFNLAQKAIFPLVEKVT